MGPTQFPDQGSKEEGLRMEFAEMGQMSEWLSILFTLLVKSVVVLTAVALLTRILRDASARLRHMLWCGALSGLLLLPLFSAGLQPLRVPVLPSTELAPQQSSLEVAQESGTQPSVPAGSQAEQSSQSNLPTGDPPTQLGFSWQSIILLVWLTGMVLVLARYLAGILIVRRLVARASELKGSSWIELSSELSRRLGLKRPVRLVRSDEDL